MDYWSEEVLRYTQSLKPVIKSQALLQKIISLTDVTRLNDNDTESDIAFFFEKVKAMTVKPAAICVYPKFVRFAANEFAGSLRVATVANFPFAKDSLASVLIEIGNAISDGAQELDVVFPYSDYTSDKKEEAHLFIASCKAACGNHVLLKIILETGALSPTFTQEICEVALLAGADFVKTSTGKVTTGATFEAVALILMTIRDLQPKLQRKVGIKVSGGIKTIDQAGLYLALSESILGFNWATPSTFRFGASQLIDEITKELSP